MEICCFPQSISTYFYKFQSISYLHIALISLSPFLHFVSAVNYHLNIYRYLIIPSLPIAFCPCSFLIR
ncbi:MAG: hypothetical protein AB1422_12945 [bacterium]